MKIFGRNKQSGFSLVELMIVVGIIGVLATLALPRFKQFQAKAKMAEGSNVIQHIYTLQQAHSLDSGVFLAFPAVGASLTSPTTNTCDFTGNAAILGFRIDPCQLSGPTPRFQYQATAATTDVFLAIARTGAGAANRICPGNATFSMGLNNRNERLQAQNATPSIAGSPVIGTVCLN